MQIRKHMHRALWFIIPFVVVIGVFTGARIFFAAPPTSSAPKDGTTATYPLLGQIIPSENLIVSRNVSAFCIAVVISSVQVIR